MGAARARRDADLDFRLAEFRIVGSDQEGEVVRKCQVFGLHVPVTLLTNCRKSLRTADAAAPASYNRTLPMQAGLPDAVEFYTG